MTIAPSPAGREGIRAGLASGDDEARRLEDERDDLVRTALSSALASLGRTR